MESTVASKLEALSKLQSIDSQLDEINKKCTGQGGVPIDTLVAGINGAERSFEITRAKPDGKSYARDIADKFGLSYEKIMDRVKAKK